MGRLSVKPRTGPPGPSPGRSPGISPSTSPGSGFPWVDGDVLFAADLNAAFLPTSGGTLTGDSAMSAGYFTLALDPTSPMHAATKQYVDGGGAGGGGGPFLPTTGGSLNGPGNLVVGGTLGVTGNATFSGTHAVTGVSTATGGFNGNTVFGIGGGGVGTGLTVNNGAQVRALTTGSNLQAPASAPLTPLIFSSGFVTGTVVGAGAWNSASVSGDTADFTNAADNSGKIWNLQYNFSGTAKGGRHAIWAQLNPSNLVSPVEVVPILASITANTPMGGSFLQPLATVCNVNALATAVGSTLNEMDYSAQANVVGVKGALQITLSGGDLFQGVSADAGLFFSNSNLYNTSPGMRAAIALGNTAQGFPVGLNGSVLTIIPQTANQGSGQNAQFIQTATTNGIDLQYLNTTLQSGYSYRAPGFAVDGTGQVRAAQGIVMGRSGAAYTIDVPATFAVNSVVPNVAGLPVVSAGASRANYYPGDLVSGSGSPAGQYQVTHTKAMSAAVTAGGSGGTNGAQVVTLTTGTGTQATVNVTVSGGAVTAVNSIATAGDYTVNPTNLNAVPVTGAGLTGATLAVGMGALTVAVLVPDVFATNITAIAVVGGSGTGLTLTATNQARSDISLQPSGGALRLPGIPASTSYASDAAAATGGVPVGQLYRNGSVLQVRVA
jgi:hypothetical protein